VQLADQLEAEQAMAKTDYECCKKLEEQFERIHEPYFYLDDDDKEQACRDKCTRERCNAAVGALFFHRGTHGVSCSVI